MMRCLTVPQFMIIILTDVNLACLEVVVSVYTGAKGLVTMNKQLF